MTLLFCGVFGLGLLEYGLRLRQARIARADQADDGLVAYDSALGWSLTPGWKGRHRNADFDVQYSVNEAGFRFEPQSPGREGWPLVAVVGDSFTFGLGVNDDQTFVHYLNQRQPRREAFLNCAIPGFSTDQEALLIEQRVLPLRPKAVLLAVYLGNDLLDNPLAFPLQWNTAKPYFVCTNGTLSLQNVPAPVQHKPPAQAALDLTTAVLGEEYVRRSWALRVEGRWATFRLLHQGLIAAPDLGPQFAARFAPAVELFDRLLARLQGLCQGQGVNLRLLLLAGRSYVEQPKTISGQYQEFFRRKVLETARQQGVPVVDAAGILRQRFARERGRWFYPNDGHLTPEGHQVVAQILSPQSAGR